MNTRNIFIIAAALLLIAASCQSVLEEQVQEEPKVTDEIVEDDGDTKIQAPDITAAQEGDNPSKSVLEVDGDGVGTIYWTPADEINVFYGTTSTHYVSQNTVNATTAVFSTTDIIGSTESASESIWGLYPYNPSATCTGSAVTTTLPATQYGVPGTFDDDLFITLAHNTSTALTFYNVCGGIKFSLSRDDITEITFRGNNDEDIAGDMSISFVEGLPAVSVISGAKTITLTPKTGTTFVPGENYYIILLPGTLSAGFTMTFHTNDGLIGSFNYTTTPVTIKRSVFSKKADIDLYATYLISFKDSWVKSQLVSAFDTDGDGELSTIEAKAVTSIGTILRYQDTIEYTFDEFQFFTGVTSLGEYAFGRNTMISIVLPSSLQRIERHAFNNSKRAIKITIPPSLKVIEYDAFSNSFDGCRVYITDLQAWCNISFGSSGGNPLSAGLYNNINNKGKLYLNGELVQTLTIPESVSSIPSNSFTGSTIQELVLHGAVVSIGDGAFGSTSLQSISFQEGILSIGSQAFSSCTSLHSIDLPATLTSIGLMAFYNCSSLSSITVRAITPPSGESMMFESTNNCPIYVPAGSVDAYKTASSWSSYADRIQAIP